MMDGVSTMDTGSNSVAAADERRVDCRGQGADLQLSGRVRPIERAADHGGDQERHQPVQRIALRRRALLRLECQQQDQHPERRSEDHAARARLGYSIGGPVGKPGGNNKLFFFYSQEFAPRTAGNNVVTYRMPTALERAGDFSQTLRQQRQPVPLHQGSAAVGDLQRVRSDRAASGMAASSAASRPTACIDRPDILNMWPQPNITGAGLAYNYELTRPTEKALAWQPAVRVDYQPSPAWRATFKYSGWTQRNQVFNGTLPGFNDTKIRPPARLHDGGHDQLHRQQHDVHRGHLRSQPERAHGLWSGAGGNGADLLPERVPHERDFQQRQCRSGWSSVPVS